MKFSLLTVAFAVFLTAPATAETFENTVSSSKMGTILEQKIEAPAIKAVVFYSDSCGSCKILDPRMKAAMPAINPEKLQVVKFDFSNKDTIEATKKLAVKTGVSDILHKYGAKSGFVILVNQDGEIVEKLTKNDETANIAGKLAMAITNASL